MTTPDTTGKRFSQAYLTDGEALSDSKRARLRVARLLGVLFDRESTDHAFALNKFMERVSASTSNAPAVVRNITLKTSSSVASCATF